MDCLIDYVGLKICADQTPPDSGVYINTLPGISLESIDKTANEDQITYAGLWADVQAEAWILFQMDFVSAMTRCYDPNPKFDYTTLICDNKKKLLNAWRYLLGSQLMIFRVNSDRLNRYTTMDAEGAQKLADYYQAKYDELLAQAVELIHIPWNTHLHEDPQPKQVVWRP